jgi:hypothetical protein
LFDELIGLLVRERYAHWLVWSRQIAFREVLRLDAEHLPLERDKIELAANGNA